MSYEPTPAQMGWVDDQEAVAQEMLHLGQTQGVPPYFSIAGWQATAQAGEAPIFFWEAEQKVLGKTLPSWNQGQVGSCVSFGWGRAAQDLMLVEIAVKGEAEEWPGAEVATEPIYGGSRVEVGGGRLRGDGSIGAWAARWVREWGILPRGVYGTHDLTRYDEARCRRYGSEGCPDELEPLAKQHPVKVVAMTETADEAWAAVGNGYPIPVCSNQGFTTAAKDGFCEPKGSWAHCMTLRGRGTHPRRGKFFVIQNSWGGYLSGERTVEVEGRGVVDLPEGCFCAAYDVVGRMLSGRDSFAISALDGFPARSIHWYV